MPALQAAGWDTAPRAIAERRTVTDGRIVPVGRGFVRKPPKRVDVLLHDGPDFPLPVVAAKASDRSAADAVQHARQCAELLGLEFTYATNRPEIIEIDDFTGAETTRTSYPTPAPSSGPAVAPAPASPATRRPSACSPRSTTASARASTTTGRRRSTASSRPS